MSALFTTKHLVVKIALRETILCAHVLRMRAAKRSQDKIVVLKEKYANKNPAQDFNSDGTVADKRKMAALEALLEQSKVDEQTANADIVKFDAMQASMLEAEPEVSMVKLEDGGAGTGPGVAYAASKVTADLLESIKPKKLTMAASMREKEKWNKMLRSWWGACSMKSVLMPGEGMKAFFRSHVVSVELMSFLEIAKKDELDNKGFLEMMECALQMHSRMFSTIGQRTSYLTNWNRAEGESMSAFLDRSIRGAEAADITSMTNWEVAYAQVVHVLKKDELENLLVKFGRKADKNPVPPDQVEVRQFFCDEAVRERIN